MLPDASITIPSAVLIGTALAAPIPPHNTKDETSVNPFENFILQALLKIQYRTKQIYRPG